MPGRHRPEDALALEKERLDDLIQLDSHIVEFVVKETAVHEFP